ncbi:helix-turn-helix domain-containing protein [Streptomyces sp. 049-1]|uniref:helix-turn-helix domain-containing protein n=1 Tax=Streptomyces sp. 049-1 TaxID=2789264 RepID=UPI00397F7BA4
MPEPHELLDEAMKHRRLELRMNWRQLADAADISYEALRAIRRGDYRPAELTARGLDEALHWIPGSVYAVFGGGEPTPVEQQAAPPAPPDTPPSLAQELEVLRRVIAATAKELGLTPDETDEAYRRAREDLAQSHPGGSEAEAEPRSSQSRRAG